VANAVVANERLMRMSHDCRLLQKQERLHFQDGLPAMPADGSSRDAPVEIGKARSALSRVSFFS